MKAEPLVCKCQNGGTCRETETGMTECDCKENFVGQYCDVRRDDVATFSRASSPAAVIVPVFLIVIVIICAVALYVYYQRKSGE